jgi:anthranilate phosphoribosyltransferase
LLNSAFALVAADGAKNIDDGLKQAAAAVDEGRAAAKLDALIRMTHS